MAEASPARSSDRPDRLRDADLSHHTVGVADDRADVVLDLIRSRTATPGS